MARCSIAWSVTERVGLAPRVVLFVVGNESRGDDALGPALLRALEADLPPDVRVVADFQLQVEHALELVDADLGLFIDAACGLDEPFVFVEIAADQAPPAFSHAVSPSAVLAVLPRIGLGVPPPAFALGIRAEHFGLGEVLSARARGDLQAALAFVRVLLARGDADLWRAATQARKRCSPRTGKNIAV